MAGKPKDRASKWESDRTGRIQCRRRDKETRGTDVILHLHAEDQRVSQAVSSPTRQDTLRFRRASHRHGRRKGRRDEKTVAEETLNAQKAIWLRQRDPRSAMTTTRTSTSTSATIRQPAQDHPLLGGRTGGIQVVALFAEAQAVRSDLRRLEEGPAPLYSPSLHHGRLRALLPNYLRFIRGVVDSPDCHSTSRGKCSSKARLGQDQDEPRQQGAPHPGGDEAQGF